MACALLIEGDAISVTARGANRYPSQQTSGANMNVLNLKRLLTKRAVSLAVLLSLVISNAFAVLPVSGTEKKASTASAPLAIYTTDLTQLGRLGRLRESLS